MKEIIKKEYEVKFKSNIFSIHSISLDNEYKLVDNLLDGKFIIKGDYKASNLSLSLTDFDYTIPFNYEFNGEVDEDSINIDILDFTYKINKDILLITVEYSIDASVSEYISEEELDKYIDDINTEVIDLREDVKEEKEDIKEMILPSIDNIDIKSDEEEYITYKIHVVREDDSLDNIVEKYKINLDILKEYNEFNELKIGMKLIIPINE